MKEPQKVNNLLVNALGVIDEVVLPAIKKQSKDINDVAKELINNNKESDKKIDKVQKDVNDQKDCIYEIENLHKDLIKSIEINIKSLNKDIKSTQGDTNKINVLLQDIQNKVSLLESDEYFEYNDIELKDKCTQLSKDFEQLKKDTQNKLTAEDFIKDINSKKGIIEASSIRGLIESITNISQNSSNVIVPNSMLSILNNGATFFEGAMRLNFIGATLTNNGGVINIPVGAGGGGGSSTFTSLTDVPNSYTGQSLKAVRVNTTATGLEFYTPTGGGITNLDYIPSPTNGIVTSDTGTDATIPLANGTNAGLTLNEYTTAEKNKLGFVTVTQAVNLDSIESNSDASKVKTDFITITQPVNLDTLESDTAINTAKVTNANHTGDATGATALTLATVNSNVGSFGSADSVAQFIVNAKGLITSAVNVVISITASQVSDFASAVNALITGKQNTVSLTTTGTSGPSTFNSSTGALNIPNYAGGGGSGNNAETFKDQNPKLDSTYGLVSGLINGTNTLFTVSQGFYLPGKLTVYFQGQAQAQASTRDFVETSPATGTFTFNIAPPTGSIIMTEYSTTGPAGTMIIQDEGVTQSAVATTINFTGPGVTATAVGPVVTVNVTGGGASTLTWDFLVDNWSVKPTKTLIPTGRVFTHTLLGTTRYRFVPTIYNPTQDAFYSNFDGTTLTNLITTRG